MTRITLGGLAALGLCVGTQVTAQDDMLKILPQLQNQQDWLRQNPGQKPTQQQPTAAGQWFCEMGFHNTAPGIDPQAVGMRFQMVVYPNGQAQGQGYDMGGSGTFPFQFQAQWNVQGTMFTVQGQKYGGMGFGQDQQFIFQSRMLGTSSMALTERHQNQKMQVYASQCQRQG